MLRFLTYLQVTPQLKRQVKVTLAVGSGLFLGYLKGLMVNSQYENVNDSKLTQYQTQDQINQLIQQGQKPAVIYYYLPMQMEHPFFRQMMFKYSNKYEDRAIWTMVNLTKKFQEAKSTFDLEYPTRVRVQVRFPKSNIAIKVGEDGQFMQLEQKSNRRQGFRFNYHQQGFKKFLQQNRIIPGLDPIKDVLQITNKALFRTFQSSVKQ